MSKNKEKEGENSRPLRKNNKLTEVNKKRGENERPLSEGGKPDDISKKFPNFSALTEAERLIFFQALTAARKNVEERGVPTRQCFGTVHDEYLKYFTQEKEEENKVVENAKEPSCLTSITHDSMSSCIGEPDVKSRSFSDGSTFSEIGKTSEKGSNKVVVNVPKPWDNCDFIIQKNTTKMLDLYFKKKKKNEKKPSMEKRDEIQLTKEKPIKSAGKKTPEPVNKRGNAEAEVKKAKSSRTQSGASTTLKVRDTSKFDALNAEEKEIFFRTLQKAHDNVVQKNPGREKEIPPLSSIMERYEGLRRVSAEYNTSRDPSRREDGNKNFRVKVILTSGDNERLSKTKSQVLSDVKKEVCEPKHKSADDLHVEGKKSKPADETPWPAKTGKSESSLRSIGKAGKGSVEIIEKKVSELNTQSEPVKFENVEKTKKIFEECLDLPKKEKKKKKEKLSNSKKSKTTPKPTDETKVKKKSGKKELDACCAAVKKVKKEAEKRAKKEAKKEQKVQRKKELKEKKEKEKKEKEREKQLKKERKLQEVLLKLKSAENTESHQDVGDSEGLKLMKEQGEVEGHKCQIIDERKIAEKCEEVFSKSQTTCANANSLEKKREESCWKLENEESEKTIEEIDKCDKIVNEEKRKVKYRMFNEEGKEGKPETAVASLQAEGNPLEVNSSSDRSVMGGEVGDSDLRLNTKGESTIAVKSLLLDDIHDHRIDEKLESDQKNAEHPIMETQKSNIVEENVSQESCDEANVSQESCDVANVSQESCDETNVSQESCNEVNVSQESCNEVNVSQEGSTETRVLQEGSTETRVLREGFNDTPVVQVGSNETEVLKNGFDDACVVQEDSNETKMFKKGFDVANVLQECSNEAAFLDKKPLEKEETEDGVPVTVDDKINKIKGLISYLEKKVEKDDHLEKEYFHLLVDYIEYLTTVLESLIVKEEGNNREQVHRTYTAAEIRFKFNEGDTKNQKMETTPDPEKDFIPRSISDENLRRIRSVPSTTESKAKSLKEKFSDWKSDQVPIALDSDSSSESENDLRLIPIETRTKRLQTTNIRLLQDLLQQRAEFVEGSIADYKIVHHPEAEDLVPEERPHMVKFLTDEDEENMQQTNKKKFFQNLLRCCPWGSKKTNDEEVFENLRGEAVRADVYSEKADDPASATINPSTMEVLKAAERKKIIEKYYSQD